MNPTAYVCPVYDEKKIGTQWHEFATHYGIFLVSDGNPNGINNPENLHALYPVAHPDQASARLSDAIIRELSALQNRGCRICFFS